MESDPASLKRIIAFVELLQRAKVAKIKPASVTPPTEQGDNIHVVVTIDRERLDASLFFWDITLLEAKGLVCTLDDDDIALGITVTDGIVDEAETILTFAENELKKLGNV
ncbi:MAG TPA: hypothetical protein EYO39_06115 [Nitrospirales bacterium]|nr:hypothetical protein [Nitrospirales bacterium]